jgi:metal-dependent amidase/aminoacylase/carboxypeptidase family protein
MIKERILENPFVDVAIAQHVFPSMEVGKVGISSEWGITELKMIVCRPMQT